MFGAILLAATLPLCNVDYRWEPAGQGWALYQGSRQVGFKHADGRYWRLKEDGHLHPEPEPCPAERRAAAEPLTGVVPEKVRPGETRINGRDVSKREAIQAIEAGVDPADATKLRVTVIGDEAARKAVAGEFESSPLLAPFRDKVLLQAVDPGSWMVRGAGFATTGNPTIYCQAPDGRVLHRQEGWRGAEKMAEALRKADPGYDPKKDPDLNKPKLALPDVDPKYLLIGALGLVVVWNLWKGKK